MSVKKIKTPATKLHRYVAIMKEMRVLDTERNGIKDEFHVELVPGQEMIGKYSVKTEEHERQRLMSVNDAKVALTTAIGKFVIFCRPIIKPSLGPAPKFETK